MDNFEQYLQENRLRLDIENLDDTCWERIKNSFIKYKRKRAFNQFYIAASILIIIGLSSVLFISRMNQNETVQTTIFPESFTDLSKQETSFLQVINYTVDEIKKQSVPMEYENLFNDFIQQLQIIDHQYALYKKEIKEHGYSEELIQQVIFNYQLKLSVLQMLQSEIVKINNLSKKESHENTNIQLQI